MGALQLPSCLLRQLYQASETELEPLLGFVQAAMWIGQPAGALLISVACEMPLRGDSDVVTSICFPKRGTRRDAPQARHGHIERILNGDA